VLFSNQNLTILPQKYAMTLKILYQAYYQNEIPILIKISIINDIYGSFYKFYLFINISILALFTLIVFA